MQDIPRSDGGESSRQGPNEGDPHGQKRVAMPRRFGYDYLRSQYGSGTDRISRLTRLNRRLDDATDWVNQRLSSLSQEQEHDLRNRFDTLIAERDVAREQSTRGNNRYFNRGDNRGSRDQGEKKLHEIIGEMGSLAVEMLPHTGKQRDQDVYRVIRILMFRSKADLNWLNSNVNSYHFGKPRENFEQDYKGRYDQFRSALMPAVMAEGESHQRTVTLQSHSNALRAYRVELQAIIGPVSEEWKEQRRKEREGRYERWQGQIQEHQQQRNKARARRIRGRETAEELERQRHLRDGRRTANEKLREINRLMGNLKQDPRWEDPDQIKHLMQSK